MSKKNDTVLTGLLRARGDCLLAISNLKNCWGHLKGSLVKIGKFAAKVDEFEKRVYGLENKMRDR